MRAMINNSVAEADKTSIVGMENVTMAPQHRKGGGNKECINNLANHIKSAKVSRSQLFLQLGFPSCTVCHQKGTKRPTSEKKS